MPQNILSYKFRYPPFSDEANRTIFEKIISEKVEIPDFFNPHARDLIERLLDTESQRRIGCNRDGPKAIKNHPWFNGINWDEMPLCKSQGPLNPGISKEGDTHNFYKYSELDIKEDPEDVGDFDEHFADF